MGGEGNQRALRNLFQLWMLLPAHSIGQFPKDYNTETDRYPSKLRKCSSSVPQNCPLSMPRPLPSRSFTTLLCSVFRHSCINYVLEELLLSTLGNILSWHCFLDPHCRTCQCAFLSLAILIPVISQSSTFLCVGTQ